MSWWDKSSFSSFATQALKSAQEKIDKALDIPEEGNITKSSESIPVTTKTVQDAKESLKSEDTDFWGNWLGDKASQVISSTNKDKVRNSSGEKKKEQVNVGKINTDTSKISSSVQSITIESVSKYNRTFEPKISENIHSPLLLAGTSLHTAENVFDGTATSSKITTKNEVDIIEKDTQVEEPHTSVSTRKSTPLKLGSKNRQKLDKHASGKSKFTPNTHEEDKIEAEIERQLSAEDFDKQVILELSDKDASHSDTFNETPQYSREEIETDKGAAPAECDISESPLHDDANIKESVTVATDSDWGDVSLSIITESQISLGSQPEDQSVDSLNKVLKEEDIICESTHKDNVPVCQVAQEENVLVPKAEKSTLEGEVREEMASLSIVIPEEEMGTLKNTTDCLLQKQQDAPDLCAKLESELLNKSLTDSSEAPDELSESNRTITNEEFDSNAQDNECNVPETNLVEQDEKTDNDFLDKICARPDDVFSADASSSQEHVKDEDHSIEKTASETLTSSSYVKNMLEEAMVESLKDTDSHSDSHSSSEMVRVDSGHTSADEIDTTTSSDIEIISHISTPTPNGDYKDRPFDLSPLRHALSRSVRRGSPPGHKRSDSSSSGTSYQSRNGDDLLSPDGPPTKYSGAESEDGGKYVGDSTRNDLHSNPLETEKLLKRLAEMAEVLDAREKKLVDMSHENMDLIETNNILRNQLHQSEEARESEMTDLNILTEEFTKRLSDTDKKMSGCIKERDVYKIKLQAAEEEIIKKSDNSATEKILKEKDQQISELLEEGEKLSKQQLQLNNNIKKLRVKEKENDTLMKSQKQKMENQSSEIEKLKKVLDNKIDNEKKHVDAITQLNSAVKKYEHETSRYKGEVEESQEKVRSMQTALDNSYREIAELHKAKAALDSEAQTAALSNEIRAKEEIQLQLERQQHNMRQQHEGLITQIEDLQLSLSRMEREHGRREDLMRQEISDLQQRLQEAEDRNQELTQSVTSATRPLLRQIENLQATYSAQVTSYEKVERNLTERLSEAQNQLAVAIERERCSSDRMMEIDMKLSSLESQVSQLRQEKSRLQANLEVERTKSEVLEEAKNHEMIQTESLRRTFEKELNDVKKEKLLMENQLEMEKMKVESEKKKVSLVHEQLKDKEAQLQLRTLSQSPSFPKDGTITPIESPMNLSMTLSQFEDPMEKSMTASMMSTNGSRLSLYESLKQTGATALVEHLQSSLKMREGEIAHLQSEISELERTRESMARELVNLSNKNDDLEDELKEFPEFKVQHQELNERYQALLQMYGEKVEEAQELNLDLQDVKDMYKSQINELLKSQGHELI